MSERERRFRRSRPSSEIPVGEVRVPIPAVKPDLTDPHRPLKSEEIEDIGRVLGLPLDPTEPKSQIAQWFSDRLGDTERDTKWYRDAGVLVFIVAAVGFEQSRDWRDIKKLAEIVTLHEKKVDRVEIDVPIEEEDMHRDYTTKPGTAPGTTKKLVDRILPDNELHRRLVDIADKIKEGEIDSKKVRVLVEATGVTILIGYGSYRVFKKIAGETERDFPDHEYVLKLGEILKRHKVRKEEEKKKGNKPKFRLFWRGGS